MRLLHYLSYSGLDETTNTFRALTIKVVDKPSLYKDIATEASQLHNITNIESLTEKLNKELKVLYRGKYFFDFCMEDGYQLDKLKLNKKHYQKIKLLQLEANDILASYKKSIENKLSQS